MTKLLAPTICFALAGALTANAETRELDAHQHGHGALNIAFEGSSMLMELEVPGADIVGFEHPAETAENRALIDAAIADLAKPLDLFIIPAEAGCTVTAAAASLVSDEDHDGKDGDDDHGHKDEHEHAVDHKDEHAAHEDDHKDEHAHDEHHSDEHADKAGASHTEFHAEYAMTCADPSAIDAIKFAYFERFPNAQELDIQMISDKGAKGFEVERDEPELDLSGAI